MLGEYFIPLVILVYLGALIGYGAWHSRRIHTQEDFAVAGRKLTAPVLVGTMLATWIGSGSLMSGAEATFQQGVTMIFMPLFSVVALIVLAQLGSRVRGIEGLTVQDIMERRYGVAPRVLSTIAMIIAYVTILSYQYRAGGAVIHTVFPDLAQWCNSTLPGLNAFLREHTEWIDASWGSVFALVFIIGYTVLGGLVSVAYTDVVNGIVMTIGIFVGVPFLFHELGGVAGIEAALAAAPAKLEFFGATFGATTLEKAIWVVNFVVPGSMLLMGDANMYQRFFAARDKGAARRAGLMLIPAVLVIECAIMGLAFLSSAAEPGLGEDEFRHVILIAAHRHLPTLLAAMLLGAAVAIVVSTADSFLLVSSNCIVRDIYHRFVNPDASPTGLVRISRWTVVVVGIVGFAASVVSKQFLSVALWAYTVYGASITPALLAAFFWKRTTTAGAAAGLAGGIVTTIVWGTLDRYEMLSGFLPDLIAGIDAVIPALMVSLALLIGVSLLTPKPKREQWAPFASQA